MAANPEYILDESGAVTSLEELAQEAEEAIAAADSRLMSAISEQESLADGQEQDEINARRAASIDAYLGRPLGNEIDGRSQVISKDLYDTVESIMPAMQRIFASGASVVDFQPEGPEDVQAAKQESEYINHVIQNKNKWFQVSYTWFKDALLTMNAYALGYWEKRQEPKIERYMGLTPDQMTLIAGDEEVEIIQHSQRMIPAPIPDHVKLSLAAQGVQQAFPSIQVHDVVIRRRIDYGCAKIAVLAPERCLVSHDADCMSVRDGSFFQYREDKTLSQLRVEGFDVPDDLEEGDGDTHTGQVDQARDSKLNRMANRISDSANMDPASRKVTVRTTWIRHDYDGDGIAELRYVVAVGSTVLMNEEVESIPVASIVPVIMPHRHFGMSLYDAVGDLQNINTMMLRAAVDNQFLLNNGRVAADINTVNIDDLQISRPLGVIRTDGPPGASLLPFQHPDTVQGALRTIEYIQSVREDRTGVQKPLAGADMDAIMAQPGTIAQLANAASQKMELIARIFAEGVKELFQVVHEVTLQNQTMPEKVQLSGTWATINPRAWKKRNDLKISVGMGVGNKQQHTAGISALIGLQQQAAPLGLTDLNKIYAGFEEFTKAIGFGNAGQFFVEPPPGTPLPPPPPDPRIVTAQINAQNKEGIEAFKGQVDLMVEALKQGAEDGRTRFEEFMQILNDREERLLRAYSEATERAQELRLASAEAKGTAADGMAMSSTLQKSEKALKAAVGMTDKLGARTDALEKSMEKLLGEVRESRKPRKRKVTSDKGRTYTIEEE